MDASLQTLRRMTDQYEDFGNTLASYGGEPTILEEAAGLWFVYPFLIEIVNANAQRCEDTDTANSEIYNARCSVRSAHVSATEVLMQYAESVDVDSSLIWQSGYHCRELINKDYANRPDGDSMWPTCLGESIHSLPADVRKAILDGCAQVARLDVKYSQATTTSSGSGTSSWLTISAVHRMTGENKGTISRWLSSGLVKDNGKTGSDRRVEAGSLLQFCQEKQIAINET